MRKPSPKNETQTPKQKKKARKLDTFTPIGKVYHCSWPANHLKPFTIPGYFLRDLFCKLVG